MCMANSTDLAYERDKFLLMFANGGENCCLINNENVTEQDIKDCNYAIEEYEELLLRAIDYGDKKEMKQLRSEIQHVKAEKRRIKKLLANKNRKEFAYS